MGRAAVEWASKERTAKPSDKLVLWALADASHQGTGTAFPSIAAICIFTGLDRKTVIAALDRLEVACLISDTGHRMGRTQQVKVYRLAFSSFDKGSDR